MSESALLNAREGQWFQVDSATGAALVTRGEQIRRSIRLRSNPITVSAGRARADGIAGAILAGGKTVQIAPKFVDPGCGTWVAGLNAYLNYVGRYRTGMVPALTRTEALRNFVDNTANQFCDVLENASRGGLPLTYSTRRATGGSPRGQLDVTASLRNLTSLKPTLEWNEVVLSTNTAAARLIRLALQLLLSQCRDGQVLRRVEMNLASWSAVRAEMPFRVPAVSRAFAHFAPVVSLAYEICLGLGRAPGTDDVGYAYVVDMERTFERLVERTLTASVKNIPNRTLSVVRQDWVKYANALTRDTKHYHARPDAVVYDGESPLLVVDAKYKSFEEGEEGELAARPAHADFYQVLTAALAHQVALALIIYPVSTGKSGIMGSWSIQVSSTYRVTLAAGNISVVGLSPGVVPTEMHSEMKHILKKLMKTEGTQQ